MTNEKVTVDESYVITTIGNATVDTSCVIATIENITVDTSHTL